MVKPLPRGDERIPHRRGSEGAGALDRERRLPDYARRIRTGRERDQARALAPADLTSVPVDRFDAGWAIAEPWLARVCARPESDLTLEGLREMCRTGRGQLILIGRRGHPPVAAGVTQVREHQGGARSCWILAVGGSGARVWLDTIDLIEATARAIGCTTVEFAGRSGWAGLLPGYAAYTHYTKRL
jgi:hypothetical protein